jgi:protein DGCR14
MFSPDADASPYHGPTGHNPRVKDPKSIAYDSTRLIEDPSPSSQSQSVPPSPTHSRIDAAIMGTPYRPRSPTTNNFSLVPNIPSPTPAELGPKAVNQLMTWGMLDATPRVISSDDPVPIPDSPFHIRDISAREVISHRLSNKASKSLRAKADLMGFGGRTPGGKKSSMPPPSSTSRKAEAPGNLTPAARRLLDRSTLGTAAARRAEVMGMRWEGSDSRKELNKVRWTPTPGGK